MRILLLPFLATLLFTSCSISKQLESSARNNVLSEEVLRTAHVGISVFEPAIGKYLYNYQGDKYFVPASNTKIPTCYAAMKYLGDSLVGLRYDDTNSLTTKIESTGDPTFLHADFKNQPIFDFLKRTNSILISKTNWNDQKWGSGWSWSDYSATYMAERSPFPMYGNTVTLRKGSKSDNKVDNRISVVTIENAFAYPTLFQDSIVDDRSHLMDSFTVSRDYANNRFRFRPGSSRFTTSEFPFVTHGYQTSIHLLSDTLNKRVNDSGLVTLKNRKVIHSQPTDSLLKPMMHRSDNFFAEQSLLMASNELLGVMNDSKIIDTILKTDFADLPQKPRWVDGSGLSRYNLFTPQDFIAILHKMKNEFGMERIREIFPTGGEGTLSSYYKKDSTFIYAKTGTLSGVVALSGFLYTKGGKELIFSVLVNNHNGSATAVRRAVEKFIQGIRERY